MNKLSALIDKGDYTLIVRNGSEIRFYNGRGISDLYRLFCEEPLFLKGAFVADKVVGKGVAALMIMGGVAALYAGLISKAAVELLDAAPVRLTYKRLTEQIWNNQKNVRCPVEELCLQASTAGECLPLIKGFMDSMKLNRDKKKTNAGSLHDEPMKLDP